MTDPAPIGERGGIDPDFRNLFDQNASYVWSSLRRLGIPERDRDDLTQEVFMTVHALLDDYERSRPFRPWVFGIAYRIVLRHRRRLGRAREVLGEERAEAAAETPSAQATLESNEARALVTTAIARIELHRRAVFIMKEVDGCSIPEIAESLGIPLNTAYSRLRLARDDFRAAVAELRADAEGSRQ